MISKIKFGRLTVKQKIYKLTNAVRELNFNDSGLSQTRVNKYIEYMNLDDDELASKAVEICNKYINPDNKPENTISPDIYIKNINFCFHELCSLIGRHQNEESFIDHRLFDKKKNMNERITSDTVIILDDIRSPFNIGSIFRSSECLGVREIALCGISPKPDSIKVKKTSMNTCDLVSWRYFGDTKTAINEYKLKGYEIYAVETLNKSIPVNEIILSGKNAFIFGNEEFGIAGEILNLCDGFIEIPMYGIKNSLNVANAFSIVAYEINKKFQI
jgi:23S rRNA (guanosine2251-2'-O)-methyltransferase